MDIDVTGPVTFDPPEFFAQAVAAEGGTLETRLLIGGKWQPAERGECTVLKTVVLPN